MLIGINHLIIVGGLFCFNFLNDKVNSEQSTPIGYNVIRLGEVAEHKTSLGLQMFKLK